MKESRALGLILGAQFVLGVFYLYNHQPFDAPDEMSHISYIVYLDNAHRLPVVDYPRQPLSVEYFQPPLYYASAWPVYRATRDMPAARQVFILRWQNLVYAVVNTYLIFHLVACVAGGKAGLLSAAFAALLPQNLFISTSVNNDVLSNLLSTAMLWVVAAGFSRRYSARRAIAVGMLAGLGLLTKMTTAGPVCAVAAVAFVRFFKEPRRQFKTVGMPLATAAIFSGWYFLRNFIIYRDPFGIGTLSAYEPSMKFSGFFKWFRLLFESFWGRFSLMVAPLPGPVYGILVVLTVLGAAGFILWAARDREWRRNPAWHLFLATAAITCLLAFYHGFLQSRQPQGRYLFPSLGPIALVLVCGWRFWWNRIPSHLRVYAGAFGFLGTILLQWVSLRSMAAFPAFG